MYYGNGNEKELPTEGMARRVKKNSISGDSGEMQMISLLRTVSKPRRSFYGRMNGILIYYIRS